MSLKDEDSDHTPSKSEVSLMFQTVVNRVENQNQLYFHVGVSGCSIPELLKSLTPPHNLHGVFLKVQNRRNAQVTKGTNI